MENGYGPFSPPQSLFSPWRLWGGREGGSLVPPTIDGRVFAVLLPHQRARKNMREWKKALAMGGKVADGDRRYEAAPARDPIEDREQRQHFEAHYFITASKSNTMAAHQLISRLRRFVPAAVNVFVAVLMIYSIYKYSYIWSRVKIPKIAIAPGVDEGTGKTEKEVLPLRLPPRELSDHEEHFDFTNCVPTEPLSTFVYGNSANDDTVLAILRRSGYATDDPSTACIFVARLDGADEIEMLVHWNGTGRNHVLVSHAEIPSRVRQRALAVGGPIDIKSHRHGIDIFAHFVAPQRQEDYWKDRVPIGATRKHVVCFLDLAESPSTHESSTIHCPPIRQCAQLLRSCSFVAVAPQENFGKFIHDILLAGAIPIVMSTTAPMPFDDVIDWSGASLRIAASQASTLPSIISRMPSTAIVEMRRRGREVLDNYLADAPGFIRGLVETLSKRMQLPLKMPQLRKTERLQSIANPLIFVAASFQDHEMPLTWQRSSVAVPNPLLPQPLLPDMTPTIQNIFGLRTHWETSQVFREGLGGSYDDEQFTIILLTYKRDFMLRKQLQGFMGLRHLNKVIVVWNDIVTLPPANWPSIHVPVEIIIPAVNSLHNRFIPFDRLETDAVLSLDDDVYSTHDEIEMAFRVWREHRKQIVGFPSRRHSFVERGSSFLPNYDAGMRCDYSMVLTSFAFVHKEFLFEYTYRLPEAIKNHIDKASNSNCEDIALNYITSHITRKPPVKVGAKTEYEFPNYQSGLHTMNSHFTSRRDCMALFDRIFGYNPLIVSQFTAHSANFGGKKGPQCMRDL